MASGSESTRVLSRDGGAAMTGQIHVTGLFEMPRYVREVEPTHLISIIQREFQPERPALIAQECHLRVEIHDISEADGWGVLPEREHVRELIEFAEQWEPESGDLMVHCYAGVSRSTAAALVAHHLRTGDPEFSARELRRAAPHAYPNRRIVALADEELGLSGSLIEAVERLGAPTVWIEEETLATLRLG